MSQPYNGVIARADLDVVRTLLNLSQYHDRSGNTAAATEVLRFAANASEEVLDLLHETDCPAGASQSVRAELQALIEPELNRLQR